ncbi:MAG: major capsid protein V20 domain-containing protein, partial [Candidatus Fonsibacter sp.]
VLNFAEVIQLTEELYAPGSLGSFNLQLQVTVENNQNEDWHGNEYEIFIMVMNCGVFVNERGTSSTLIGLLTKQDVLDALQQPPYKHKLPGQHPLRAGLGQKQAADG